MKVYTKKLQKYHSKAHCAETFGSKCSTIAVDKGEWRATCKVPLPCPGICRNFAPVEILKVEQSILEFLTSFVKSLPGKSQLVGLLHCFFQIDLHGKFINDSRIFARLDHALHQSGPQKARQVLTQWEMKRVSDLPDEMFLVPKTACVSISFDTWCFLRWSNRVLFKVLR